MPPECTQRNWDAARSVIMALSAPFAPAMPPRADRSSLAQEYVDEILKPRNGVENVMKWACGRPLASDLTGTACLRVLATHQSKPGLSKQSESAACMLRGVAGWHINGRHQG